MEKKSLNEAIMEEAEIPNLKNTFEDSRTHVDMPYGLGSAYIESEKRRKEIEDKFKEKDKEMEEYKKMYASEESKTRIKPEVNKKMYLSESLFEDTVKTKSGKWVNKGDTGETHGEFKTKKAADEQRKAMFANGWKKESLKEAEISKDQYYSNKINEFLDKLFLEAQRDVGAKTGDISPEQSYELDEHIQEIARLIIEVAEQNREGSPKFIDDYKEKEITEAKVRPEDDVDFDEFDMFAFISNLFVKDMKPDLLPLKSIGGFDSQGKELTATEDSIILGTNNEEDFDEVKKICDEYDFGHRDIKVPNGKSKFYHEIDVPTYENGYPMDVAEYFEEVEIPLEEVMPEKYIRKLKASRKNTASAFDKKKK